MAFGSLALLSPIPLVAMLLGLRRDLGHCLPNPAATGCDPLIIAGFVAACACLLLIPLPFYWLKWSTKFVRVMRDTPHRVVWLYVEGTTIRSFVYGVRVGRDNVSNALIVGLDDGSKAELLVKGIDPALFEALGARAPQATLGYSDEHWRTFAQNPSALVRAAA